MARGDLYVEVEGAKELARTVRRIKDKGLSKATREAHKAIGGIIAEPAARDAPQRTGRLRRSVKGSGTTSEARVQAGTAARVPYAGVIHYGWAAHNIEAQPFIDEALETHFDEIPEAYLDHITPVIREIESRGR